MLELPPIEQIEFFPSSLHLSVSTECLHPCHMGKVQGVIDIWVYNIELWKAAEIKEFQIIRLQDKSQKTSWYI
jgi:hypothetical protein